MAPRCYPQPVTLIKTIPPVYQLIYPQKTLTKTNSQAQSSLKLRLGPSEGHSAISKYAPIQWIIKTLKNHKKSPLTLKWRTKGPFLKFFGRKNPRLRSRRARSVFVTGRLQRTVAPTSRKHSKFEIPGARENSIPTENAISNVEPSDSADRTAIRRIDFRYR